MTLQNWMKFGSCPAVGVRKFRKQWLFWDVLGLFWAAATDYAISESQWNWWTCRHPQWKSIMWQSWWWWWVGRGHISSCEFFCQKHLWGQGGQSVFRGTWTWWYNAPASLCRDVALACWPSDSSLGRWLKGQPLQGTPHLLTQSCQLHLSRIKVVQGIFGSLQTLVGRVA